MLCKMSSIGVIDAAVEYRALLSGRRLSKVQ